jgi:hypothetical protein
MQTALHKTNAHAGWWRHEAAWWWYTIGPVGTPLRTTVRQDAV